MHAGGVRCISFDTLVRRMVLYNRPIARGIRASIEVATNAAMKAGIAVTAGHATSARSQSGPIADVAM